MAHMIITAGNKIVKPRIADLNDFGFIIVLIRYVNIINIGLTGKPEMLKFC
jgi:hypothetical protein